MIRRTFQITVSLLAAPLFAQQDWTLTPTGLGTHIALDAGQGNTVYAINRSFGFDSSRVEVMWCDAQQNVLHSTSFRGHFPLNFLNEAKLAPDGVLFTGTAYGSVNIPSVLKVDTLGNVQWYSGLNGLNNLNNHYQDQLNVLLVEGSNFTAYTYPGGTWRDGVFRYEGSTATGFSGGLGTEVFTPFGVPFRITCGGLTNTLGTHLLGGSGYMNDSSLTKELLLMKMNDIGAEWMRFYDMGSAAPFGQGEEASAVKLLADGNHVVSGSLANSSNQYEAFLLKVDPQGAVLWCRKYRRFGGGFLLSDTYELPTGELLVSGADEQYRGLLLLLAADGTLQWTKRYLSTGITATNYLHNIRPAYPNGYWIHTGGQQLYLDGALNGCDFEVITEVSESVYTPAVFGEFYTNTTEPASISALDHFYRTPEFSWSAGCMFNGIGENADKPKTFEAWPNPTDGLLYLRSENRLQHTPVVVRDLMGREQMRGPYVGWLDLQDLAAGAYVVDLPELGQRTHVVKR